MYQLNKPRIKIPLTKLDWWMEFLCFGAMVFNWVYAFVSFSHLPNSIPTHFNFSGTVDGMGNKSSIFILPIIGSCIYLLLTLIGQFPNMHNYIVKVTQQNAVLLYTASSRLLRYLKLFICAMFGFILIETLRLATQSFLGLSPLFLPIFIIGLIVPIIFFLIKMGRYKKVSQQL